MLTFQVIHQINFTLFTDFFPSENVMTGMKNVNAVTRHKLRYFMPLMNPNLINDTIIFHLP